MVERDVVLAKTAVVERCLDRIEVVTGLDPARLADIDVCDIFVLNLQRAIQACIDIAHHIVSAEAMGLPNSLADAFRLLEAHGQLPADLADRMRAMVGFRNIAVHDYEALDRDILEAILLKHLDDLRAYCRFAIARL